ncbi:MAG: hypothetical protein ACT4P6_21730 [Gemmatimonadaceae bacterium]
MESERNLPAAVTRSLAEKYPRATYRIIEDVLTEEGSAERLAYYEVLLELVDKRFLEVQIAPDGRVLKQEKKSAVEPESRRKELLVSDGLSPLASATCPVVPWSHASNCHRQGCF